MKNLCQTPEEVSDLMKHLHQHNVHIDEEMRMTVMLYEDGQESTLNHLIKLQDQKVLDYFLIKTNPLYWLKNILEKQLMKQLILTY